MQEDNDPFADLKRRGAAARRQYNDAAARGDAEAQRSAGLKIQMIHSENVRRAQELQRFKEAWIARFEQDNAENRNVLDALEDGRIRTHLNNVDTTEADKVLYRGRIAELDRVIEKVREYGLD